MQSPRFCRIVSLNFDHLTRQSVMQKETIMSTTRVKNWDKYSFFLPQQRADNIRSNIELIISTHRCSCPRESVRWKTIIFAELVLTTPSCRFSPATAAFWLFWKLESLDKALIPSEDVEALDSVESCLKTEWFSSTTTLCKSTASTSSPKVTLFWSELPDPTESRLCSESDLAKGLGFWSSGSGEWRGISRNWWDLCDPLLIFIDLFDFTDFIDLLDFFESVLSMKFWDFQADFGASSMLKVGLSMPPAGLESGLRSPEGSFVLRLDKRLSKREPACNPALIGSSKRGILNRLFLVLWESSMMMCLS